ncbi:MAG: alpha/beta hydrolase [Polyangiales bacterium]
MRLPNLSLATIAALVAVEPACTSSAEDVAPSTHVTFALDGGVPRFGAVPFPSDLQRASGQVARLEGFSTMVGAHEDALRDGLAALDGFGRTTPSVFFLDGDVDPSSLAEPSAMLVDVDRASPERGRTFPVVTRAIPSLRVVSVLPRPGTVLAPGRRYAAILTSRVRSANGTPLAAADAFAALARATCDARKTDAEKLYGDALDALVESHAIAGPGDVAGLAVFTTSRAVMELPALRDRVRALAPPKTVFDEAAAAPYAIKIFSRTSTPNLDDWLGTAPDKDETGKDWPGLDNPGGVPHDSIGAIATFAYESPSFLDAKTHHFERGPDGSFRLADEHALVPVTMVVPSTAPPAEGFPVVVAAHGLGGTRNNMLAIANELARAGFVVVGIDDVQHGARRGTKDLQSNYAGSYRGPDGLPDHDQLGGLDFFAGFVDLLAIRDNFRQTVLDHVSLVRLVQSASIDLAPLETALGGKAPLDGSKVFWTGGSFGGIMGATTVAIEPELRAASLQVPGGGFLHFVVPKSAQMSGLVSSLVMTAYGLDGEAPIDAFHPLIGVAATIVEAGDPLSYAPHVFASPFTFDGKPRSRPANVLLTYALDDEVLPNGATYALVRAMGLTAVGAPIRPIAGVPIAAGPVRGNLGGGTGAAIEYSPATHALGYQRWGDRAYGAYAGELDDGPAVPLTHTVRIEMPIREHIAGAVHFFRTATEGTAEAMVTSPARAFDPK